MKKFAMHNVSPNRLFTFKRWGKIRIVCTQKFEIKSLKLKVSPFYPNAPCHWRTTVSVVCYISDEGFSSM